MLKRVLIANRGEIAIRIIRACRELNIETVAVYSTADKDALHIQTATKSVCIGPAKSQDSYLNINNIISAALATGCDAIHPGYGFLSENSDFARLCEKHGIKFIGPSADVIDNMGNKAKAKALMISAGVPVVPGSEGVLKDYNEAKKMANDMGYPIMLKASSGGGGRGIRIVNEESELLDNYNSASLEAVSCFGEGSLYMEKYIYAPKHIEFQILADNHGNVFHLGERDCSVQRRGQKLLEEAPSPALSSDLREAMGDAAVKAAKAANYTNAGTIEFILDKDNNFYFIEMNTRIQVEHPVTEMITGIDIVKEQLRIASNLSLSFKEVTFKGHAIECRINAEDTQKDFAPSPGKIEFLHFAGGNGVRVDSSIYNGMQLVPFYDSMVGKIIVHGATRLEAIRKMRRALEETVILGVKTTLEFQHLLMYHKEILKGDYNTFFVGENIDDILKAYKEATGEN